MSQEFFDLIRQSVRDVEAEPAARMNEILEISRIMNATLDEEVLLPYLMDRVVDLMGADRGHLVLLRISQDHLDGAIAPGEFPWEIKVSLVRGRDGALAPDEAGLLSKTVIRQVIEGEKPLLIEDALQDDLVARSRSVHELGLRSVMATPLISRNRVIGVLSVENRKAVGAFNAEDLDFLEIFGAQAAVAIENAGLYRNLKETQAQLSRAHKALKLEVVESQTALRSERQKLQTMESEIRHLDKMAAMGMMVSSIAHELNNPLTGVLGFADLLSRGDNLTDKQRKWLGHITSEMERCAEIIRNLLRFSRKSKEQREVVDLGALVREAVELRRYQFEVNNVHLAERYPTEPLLVSADGYQLKGVFLNLLSNAYDAIRAHERLGTIWVELREEGDKLVLEVSDTGGGIKELEKIFDPFYTTKDVGKGTGLGLSVAYGVVHGHGGKITARNTDVGACLSLSLPRAEPGLKLGQPRASVDGAADLSAPRGNLTVLVVDDEMVIRDLCRAVLEGEGYAVEVAASGQEAQKLLANRAFDLVVTDLRMPGGMSGMDLFRWMEAHFPQLARRVLFITGDLMTQELRAAMDTVGQRVLTKPFEVPTLLHAVRETLQRAEGAVEA